MTFAGSIDRDAVDGLIRERAGVLAGQGRRPLAVPRGGATPVGASASAWAADELALQLEREGIGEATLVVPVGSGTTVAGLLAGGAATRWRIVGASVSRPPAAAAAAINALAGACAALLGRPDPPVLAVRPAAQDSTPRSADAVAAAAPARTAAGASAAAELVDARGPGFGIASAAGSAAADLARRTEGLLVDPVYGAKALAVALDRARVSPVPVVLWHGGGIVATLGAGS